MKMMEGQSLHLRLSSFFFLSMATKLQACRGRGAGIRECEHPFCSACESANVLHELLFIVLPDEKVCFTEGEIRVPGGVRR